MVSFGEAIKQQGRVVMCNLLGGPASVPYLGGTPNQDINALQQRINGARKYFCNEHQPVLAGDIPSPGFSGGQCPGVFYTVSFTATNFGTQRCDNGNQQNNPGPFSRGPVQVLGPIGSIVRRNRTGSCGSGIRGYQWVAIDGSGQEVNLGIIETGFPAELFATGIDNPTFSISRTDGGSDDCGNPSPIIPPYVPTPIVINIEYEDNDNITINEDVTYNIFAPVVLIGGAIIAPITVTGNDFSLVGEVALNGEFELSFSPDFQLNIGGSVDNPIPPPGRPIELPEVEPSSRVIVGAIVTVTDAQGGRATQIGQGTNPDIFAPRLGNISFYVSTSRGTAWTTDVPIKNVRQYVQCPYPFGAVDVAGTPETGYAFDVQPVFDRPLLEPA